MPNENTLISNLDAILEALTKLGRPVVPLLQEGKRFDSVAQSLRNVGLGQNDSVAGLFEWRNGTLISTNAILDDIHFFPGFYFLSFEDALSQYLATKNDGRWKPEWFPLFANDGGDFYAVDLGPDYETHGAIIGFILGELDQLKEYDSLQSMMATVAECYRQGVFYVTNEGWLEMDSPWHAKIARKFNPKTAIWVP